MSLRRIRENWSDAPATYSIGALWVLTYLLMALGQWQGIFESPASSSLNSLGPLGIGAISETTGQTFGAWNSSEILVGQIWRTILATFVHFGLVHIALNLFGMIQLGQLVEEWYGPKLTITIVVLIGFLGNGLAALARPLFGQPSPYLLQITSGGGSTVVFGLIGLVAMVGKRSRSRMGRYLYNQMVGLLVFNFLIGLTIPQIDNYAHAGGAIAGAIIGRFHHKLLSWVDHKPRLCRALLATTVLILCASVTAQIWVYRLDQKIRQNETRLILIGHVSKSLNDVKSSYVNRAILGLKSYQVVNQKPRLQIQIPYFQPLLIPMSNLIVEENRIRLDQKIDASSQLIQTLNSPAINPIWQNVLVDARWAVSRPPTAAEIQPFIEKLSQLDKTLQQLANSLMQSRLALGKKLIIWRMPWPGIVWTELGPALSSQQIPKPQPQPLK